MERNFDGVPSSGSSSSSAEARRRRKLLVVEKDRGFVKRKRTAVYRSREFVPPPLPPNIMNQGRLVFLFCKKLQKSDVNHVGRTVLPKQPTETHLPRLVDNESIILPVIDLDGVDAWAFKFRYWANNQSRMYVFEGTGPFTKKHNLETGDYMLMYRDLETWDYVIRAVKSYEVEGYANKEVATNSETKAESVLPNDATFDLVDYPTDFPNMEDMLATTIMNDDCYFSEILNSFSSWDNFMTNYYPPSQPRISFDNLSDEDLSQV